MKRYGLQFFDAARSFSERLLSNLRKYFPLWCAALSSALAFIFSFDNPTTLTRNTSECSSANAFIFSFDNPPTLTKNTSEDCENSYSYYVYISNILPTRNEKSRSLNPNTLTTPATCMEHLEQ